MSENLPEENNRHERKRRRGLFFPLLLLGTGVLLLLSNFGYIQGGFWGFVETYWPALLILAGLDGLIKGEGITSSLFIAGVGGLLLAGNLGIATISAWDMLAKGWPLILVGIGIDIIVGRHSVARAVIGIFMAILLVGGMFWLADISFPGTGRSMEFTQPYQDESSLKLTIERTAGRIFVDAAKPGNDLLLKGEFNLLKNEKMQPSVEQDADSAKIRFDTGKNAFPGAIWPSQNSTWKIKVNPEPKLMLKTNLAMGETRLDLRELAVTEVDSEQAMGKSEIFISTSKDGTYHVSGAMGEIVIRVPKGAAVSVSVRNAIGVVSCPDNYSERMAYIPQGLTVKINQPSR